MSQSRQALSVSEITAQIKGQIESQFNRVWVQGEISNFKHHSSGHMYFTVKDAEAELRCVMFRGFNQSIHFKPEDGMDVFLQGKITVYEPRGQYQLMVQLMEPAGIGTLFLAFEALKNQLQGEGLFDPFLKKPLPPLPKKIGIVTSQTGAAYRDMVNVLNRRAPYVEIILRPALVQGDDAAADIVSGIQDLMKTPNVDAIIIGRGGGSLEDLWAFNEEVVARTIHACDVPIISAVGHETDVTISDMVADLRAPTPSAAAELAAPSVEDLLGQINHYGFQLDRSIKNQLNRIWQKVDHLSDRHALQNPQQKLDRQKEKLSILHHELSMAMTHMVSLAKTKLKGFEKELSVLSPFDILHRGFSIGFTADGRIIRKADDLQEGDPFTLKTGEGQFEAEKKKALGKDD
ncbi:MAG: exodeoxyribonuclease VII large subunit [Candidatus Marinimicrobia bacterium]|jgi:exodeoxyribonuclease VII large subunit|nr:exodeoxyribonuclease VII large subunit [Candidatus Neomarinimicrobiota bacterium]